MATASDRPACQKNRPATVYSKERTKQEACRRVALVQGQVRGILGMIEGDRECVDILTQVVAARAALDSLGSLVLTQHVADLIGPDETPDQRVDLIREALDRFVR